MADPSGSKPAARRPAGQPKSSRQQFSACGACRIRRVRCDLKDLPDSNTCSNCQEHGFNCVDEYRDVKAVKLLRRGRRIQQVEAVYGAGGATTSKSPECEQAVPTASQPPHTSCYSIIPRLNPRFFDSRFYARFHIQRPIIEPEEFKARYTAFYRGNCEALGVAGQLIAMLLVIWAASYGVDPLGREEAHDGALGVRRRKQKTNEMVRELLHLIDTHGLPRKPSWDGVRVLLLIMPLTEEVAEPLERLTMYETAINQVYTLCSLASPRSVNSGQGEQVDALVRARIYWYAFVHEGITTGLRGGRLHLADDDLAAFQVAQDGMELSMTRSQLTLTYSRRWALAPLRLASACRQVNSALTGAKARTRQDVDGIKLKAAWEAIEKCWEEFESLRELGLLGILTVEEADRFVDGWKIFIFECHNVIREFLKQRLVSVLDGDGLYIVETDSRQATLASLDHLHTIAESKCQDVAQHVVSLVRRHLGTSFFEYDASLVRDGCFFAGYMLAGLDGSDEQSDACLRALSDMRWAFSKSEERVQTLKLIWEARRKTLNNHTHEDITPPPSGTPPCNPGDHQPHTMLHQSTLDLDNRQSREIHQQDSTTAGSSPAVLSSSRLHDEERVLAYRDSSISSGSSAFSADSPYTPTVPVHPMHGSNTLSSHFDSKSSQVPHVHIPDHVVRERPFFDPGAGTNGPYQYVENTVYTDPALHHPLHPDTTNPNGHIGLDGLLYAPPNTEAIHISPSTPGNNHSYRDNPYFYSK
ncbi:hypothetical protein K439DRAFT_87429 [Ramaria rubella]|nr:hypothetical protein K439DRAFT_87429 [Ramaria rubella]